MSIVNCFLSILSVILWKRRRGGDREEVVVNKGMEVEMEEEVDIVSEEVFFPFGNLPDLVVKEVLSRLSYDDLCNMKLVSSAINGIAVKSRSMMKGPEVDIFVKIQDGRLSVSTRPHRIYYGQARDVPVSERSRLITNADVTLYLRFGGNLVTPELAMEIENTFKRAAKIEKVQLTGDSISTITKDLINKFNSPSVLLNIRKFDECLLDLQNLESLRINERLNFFEVERIFNYGYKLDGLSLHVSIASVEQISNCIEQWSLSQRKILDWNFKLPQIDIPLFGEVTVDWRSSRIERHDGSAQLSIRKTISEDDENQGLIQNISFMSC